MLKRQQFYFDTGKKTKNVFAFRHKKSAVLMFQFTFRFHNFCAKGLGPFSILSMVALDIAANVQNIALCPEKKS